MKIFVILLITKIFIPNYMDICYNYYCNITKMNKEKRKEIFYRGSLN